MRRVAIVLGALALACTGVLVAAGLPTAGATQSGLTFYVNSTTDTGASPTDCQLPGNTACGIDDAIAAFNADATVGNQDHIAFGSATVYTVTTPVTISNTTSGVSLSITGNGASNTQVSGDNATRVFAIATDTTVQISDVTITGGFGGAATGADGGNGGGIFNQGALTISSTTVSQNAAGRGWYGRAGGMADGAPGTNGGDGGGIYNEGMLTISQSTISGNGAGDGGAGGWSDSGNGGEGGLGGSGGGIYNLGSLSISSSTVTGNYAGAGGWGGYSLMNSGGHGGNGGNGGGVANEGSFILNAPTLLASGVSENAVGQGGLNGPGAGYTPGHSTSGAGSNVFGGFTLLAAPSAPTITGSVSSDASASVTWSEPTSSGSNVILYYVVEAVPTAGATVSQWVLGARTSASLTGLVNGTPYTITVSAVSAAGASVPSASASVTPAAAPSAPTKVSTKASGPRLTVSWKPPTALGGAAITSYTATVSPSGKSCTTVTLTCAFSGLSTKKRYTVSVTATNAAGPGAAATLRNIKG